jgi:photosystem II stability/assembly factor-like uncharacterized protein
MKTMRGLIHILAALGLGLGLLAPHAMAAEPKALEPTPAKRWANAGSALLLGAARAGDRLVAVGEHGIVLLSDDDGKTFRQARSVPVSSTLTAVSFADARRGWAVGHWGAIIATGDGGETWDLQRSDTGVDQPLFSVHFTSPDEGWAVGLWSLFLHTADGGKTWAPVALSPPPGAKRADRNLTRVFGDPARGLYVTAEGGMVLRSPDGGRNWTYQDTGYRGTLWTGVLAADGTVVVGGLSGSLFQSRDQGASWRRVDLGAGESITDLAEIGGEIVGVGLSGLTLRGKPGQGPFSTAIREEKRDLTAVVPVPSGGLLITSSQGTILAGSP